MAINLSSTVLFIIISAIIVLLITILIIVEYQLKKRKALERESIEYRFTKRFLALKNSDLNPADRISAADKLARDYLTEKYGIKTKADYSQLADYFMTHGKMHILPFCQTMIELLYSGGNQNSANAHIVLISLESMFRREGILSVMIEDKEKNDKNFILDSINFAKRKVLELKPKKQNDTVLDQNNDDNSNIISKKVLIIPKEQIKDINTEKPAYRFIGSIDSKDRLKEKLKIKNNTF